MSQAAKTPTSKPKRSPMAAGQRYGRLVAVAFVDMAKGGNARWQFFCDCGQQYTARIDLVRHGRIISCGCAKREKCIELGKASKIHGMKTSAEYGIWVHMCGRCNNPNNHRYPLYGGRGIKVCEHWARSFLSFYADMGPRPSPKHSVDRYPNQNGNYEPGNVRWATQTQQTRNKRNNRIVSYEGRDMCLTEACELAGLNYWTVCTRLRKGWSEERALSVAPPGQVPKPN